MTSPIIRSLTALYPSTSGNLVAEVTFHMHENPTARLLERQKGGHYEPIAVMHYQDVERFTSLFDEIRRCPTCAPSISKRGKLDKFLMNEYGKYLEGINYLMPRPQSSGSHLS